LSTRLYRSDEGAPRPAPADGAMPADALICGACRASSAIRWHPVDMRPGFGVPVMFPSNDSLTRHPRPSAGFRGRVSRLLRYHEVIRLPTALPARLRVLRLTGTDPRACLCSHAARRPPLGLELWVGQLPCPHFRIGSGRISQVPGEPCCAYALLSDPGRITVPKPLRGSDTAPASSKTKAPTISRFRGSITRPWHSLSTLRPDGHPLGRKTRFRLLARLCRVGLITHKVPAKGFRFASYIASSFPKLPGATNCVQSA
jgi:hypothetical protein